jgi:hypothetical protein
MSGVLIVQGTRKISPPPLIEFHHVLIFTDVTSRPKRRKYPYGYPGDAPGSGDELDPAEPQTSARTNSRRRIKVRYSCHNCQAKFKPTELTCQNCGHEKCNECPRVAPRKVEPEPDPEVVRRVQEKLQALGMGGASAISPTADPPPEGLPEVNPAEG